MKPEIEVTSHTFADSGKLAIIAKFDDFIGSPAMQSALLSQVVMLIAERYVSENYQEIVAGISQEAIATMSVAEAAAKIRESLEKQINVRVVEKTKTQVYQRGILGGMRRML